MAFTLRPGLHCCEAGGRIVFLDVPADRYFALDPACESAFRAALDPAAPDAPAVEALVRRGLLEPAPGKAPLSIAPAIEFVRRSLLDGPLPSAQWLDTLRAAAATVRSRRQLSRQGLAAALSALGRQRVGSHEQPDQTARIAAAFDGSRMLLDSLDHCLPDAIALAKVLFRRGCAAHFVIAVRGRPFRAHSWVQAGDMVLSDRLDRVRGFVPILAI